jgi:cobalamin biosynthesis Mg chelatase CobN
MKKAILMSLLAIFLFSCASKKIVTQTSTDQKTTQQNAVTTVSTDLSKDATLQSGKTTDSTSTVTTTVEYDTTKPVDSITGRAPVIKETKTIQTKVGNKVTTTKKDVAVNTKLETKDNSKTTTAVSVDTKTKEIPKTPAVKYYLYILVIVIALVVVFWSKIKKLLSPYAWFQKLLGLF